MPEKGSAVPVGGIGIGTMRTPWGDQTIIDTGSDGVPEKPIDLMLYPTGDVRPIAVVQIPRGSIVTVIDPMLAVQVRAQIRAMQRTQVPEHAPRNPHLK